MTVVSKLFTFSRSIPQLRCPLCLVFCEQQFFGLNIRQNCPDLPDFLQILQSFPVCRHIIPAVQTLFTSLL